MDKELMTGELLLSADKDDGLFFTIVADIIAVLLVFLALFYFFIAYTPVIGHSMENTVTDGQSAILLRRGYELERGDIITVNVAQPDEENHILIKRVIGLGGDRLLFVRADDKRTVDLYICKAGADSFEILEEPYIKERMLISASYYGIEIVKNFPRSAIEKISVSAPTATEQYVIDSSVLVQKDRIFYLGDNRNYSSDSRYYGACTYDRILGKAIAFLDKDSFSYKIMNAMFYGLL